MPVTARLSGKFYQQFGDEITNELVDWFNAVDSTYQTQLKEMNDLNWARMQARFDAFDARLDAFEARLIGRMDAFEERILGRIGALDGRMDTFEERILGCLGAQDGRVGAFESRISGRMDAFEAKITGRMDAFEVKIEARLEKFRREMVFWMFGFWSATVIPIIGVMLALSGVFHR